MTEKQNASRHAQIFYCRHMTPGLAGYENETLLIDNDAMQRMAPTMVGKPVYIGHQTVDLSKLSQADGFVTDCFYNQSDGALWAKCIAITDAAHNAISNGWAVSNAYIPQVTDKGGKFHNVDYDRKIVEASFTHLALVPDPRYEEAVIYTPEEYKAYQETKKNQLAELQNSKTKKGILTMKIFKNNRQEVTDMTQVDLDCEIEISNGITKTIREMVAEVEKSEKEEKLNSGKVKCNGEDMTVDELKNRFEKMMKNKKAKKEKKNEDDDVDGEDGEEGMENADDMENSDDDEFDIEPKKKPEGVKEEKKNKGKEKKNSIAELTPAEKEHIAKFRQIQNAADKGKKHTAKVTETSFDRDARGLRNYGSAAK